MNASPRKRWMGFDGDPTHNPGCGRLAMESTRLAAWQSALTSAGQRVEFPPPLTCIPTLARQIRAAFAEGTPA